MKAEVISPGRSSDAAMGRGFTSKFGLHPGMALLTVGVDTMLFASDIATAGFIIPLTLAVAAGLGVVTFMAQKKWYGDDNESAFIKAAIVAGLTAIPTSLPGFLCAPAGVVGLFHRKRG
ncbi:hypothetical protein [Granulicella aggregans]|uniref:hypothetical protein n=1 Tax=Granulicella aggregans TaxID=474949 RepID=UPI0021DFCEF5|nr:hypothetical protein [Granulicella aggregans]